MALISFYNAPSNALLRIAGRMASISNFTFEATRPPSISILISKDEIKHRDDGGKQSLVKSAFNSAHDKHSCAVI